MAWRRKDYSCVNLVWFKFILLIPACKLADLFLTLVSLSNRLTISEVDTLTELSWIPGPCFNIKMPSYQNWGPQVKDKTVSRQSYLWHENPILGKTVLMLKQGPGFGKTVLMLKQGPGSLSIYTATLVLATLITWNSGLTWLSRSHLQQSNSNNIHMYIFTNQYISDW